MENHAELGALQRSYSASGTVRKILLGVGFFLVLLIGASILVLTNTKPADIPLAIALIGGAAVLLVGLALFGIWRVRSEVLLFDEGLIEKRGGQETICRWDEIEALAGMVATTYRGMQVYVGGPLVLTRVDGRKLTLSDGLDDSVQLIEVVTAKVLGRLLPEARAALDRGETVSVGPLRVDRFGVAQGEGDLLPWGDVEEIAVVDDLLVIRRTGFSTPWSQCKLEKTPNAVLLLELGAELKKES